MSTLKMKTMKRFFHTITGDTFVVGLHDSINDDIIFKFMITDDNKQLCYLDNLNLTLKNDLCECYTIIVDVPTTNF